MQMIEKELESRTFAKLDSHQRMLDRQKAREEHARQELESSQARLLRRRRLSVDERVERAAEKLKGANVATAISVIQNLSSAERDFYLLAEEHLGLARKSVLRSFPPPRKSIRADFLRGAAPTAEPEAAEAQTEEQDGDQEAQ